MGPLQFDGYETVVHFTAEDGTDVRVIFERHESEALQAFIASKLSDQRERLRSLTQCYAELSEPAAEEPNMTAVSPAPPVGHGG